MRQRCRNPNNPAYIYYGGRGITVCPEWESFERFLSDMGRRPSPHHSIERIDNDGPYSPENCRWATRQEQRNNRRDSIALEFGGETRSLVGWAAKTGVKYKTLLYRYKRNQDPVHVLREAL